MTKRLRFLILLIPLLGIAALLGIVWDGIPPEARGFVSSFIFKAAGLGSLGVFGLLIVSQVRRNVKRGPLKTKIIGARVGDGIGELTVEASHSSQVSRLSLPAGARIVTVTPNRLYKVELSSSRRSVVEAIARENGYKGVLGNGD